MKRIQITLTFHIPHFTFHMQYNFCDICIQRKDFLSVYERIPMERIFFINTIDPVRKSFAKYTKIRSVDVKKCEVGGESDYCGSKLFLSLTQNERSVSFFYPFCTANNMNSEQSTCISFWIRSLVFLCVHNFWRLATCSLCIGMVPLNTEDQYRRQVLQCTHFIHPLNDGEEFLKKDVCQIRSGLYLEEMNERNIKLHGQARTAK